MPRSSACHDTVQLHPLNKIEGNHDATEHIRFALENVINNKDFVSETAEVYFIAIENGAETLLDILDADCRFCSIKEHYRLCTNGLQFKSTAPGSLLSLS